MKKNTYKWTHQTTCRDHHQLVLHSSRSYCVCPECWSYRPYPALYKASIAYKTPAKYKTIEVEGSIPPLKHQADLNIRRYATRLNKLPTSSAVIQRLPDKWRSNNPPEFPHHYQHPKHSQENP